jgi:CRISPR-associated protein Cmr3
MVRWTDQCGVAVMFKYIITVQPLGFMYASAGAFLSPDNLVGRSGAKFPPDTGAIAGLFFSTDRVQSSVNHEDLKLNLTVAGPFWTEEIEDPEYFYVPVPKHRIIAKDCTDEWRIEDHEWKRRDRKLKAEFSWQKINYWNDDTKHIQEEGISQKKPWEFVPVLHPSLQDEQRHVKSSDGLFVEQAVQLREDVALVYLSTHPIKDNCYRFGGEGHIVEVKCKPLDKEGFISTLLKKPIKRCCALISPGVWGSENLSYRYPKHPDFPKRRPQMLTERPVPFRYRLGAKKNDSMQQSRLSRGRYAVPAGSVYIFNKPLGKTWWDFPEGYFPKEGFSLKQLGCGLCLPIDIQGVH